MKYNLIGILGTTVGSYNSVQDTISAVLKQVPLSKKKTSQLRGRIERAKSGQEVAQDYGTTTVYIEVL